MVLVRKRRGGRRHKKLKAIDPFYSGPRKLLLDKWVDGWSNFIRDDRWSSRNLVTANQAPKKGEKNDTKVSYRFQQFLENKQHAEDLQKKAAEKKKNKNKFKTTSTEEDEQFPHLKQKPNESDRNYLRRLDQVGVLQYSSTIREVVAFLGSEIRLRSCSIWEQIWCEIGGE